MVFGIHYAGQAIPRPGPRREREPRVAAVDLRLSTIIAHDPERRAISLRDNARDGLTVRRPGELQDAAHRGGNRVAGAVRPAEAVDICPEWFASVVSNVVQPPPPASLFADGHMPTVRQPREIPYPIVAVRKLVRRPALDARNPEMTLNRIGEPCSVWRYGAYRVPVPNRPELTRGGYVLEARQLLIRRPGAREREQRKKETGHGRVSWEARTLVSVAQIRK